MFRKLNTNDKDKLFEFLEKEKDTRTGYLYLKQIIDQFIICNIWECNLKIWI